MTYTWSSGQDQHENKYADQELEPFALILKHLLIRPPDVCKIKLWVIKIHNYTYVIPGKSQEFLSGVRLKIVT